MDVDGTIVGEHDVGERELINEGMKVNGSNDGFVDGSSVGNIEVG